MFLDANSENAMEHKLIMLPGARNVRLWKFFGLESKDGRKIDAKESNGVFCKIFSCVKPEIRYSGNTTNMVHHLQREHHREHAQYLGFSGADSNTRSSATGLRPFVNRPRSVIGLDSVRGQEITRCIVGVMVCDLRPFDIVNDTGFNKMIECLAPEYQLASRQYYASQVAGKYFFDCNQTSGNVPKGQGTTVIGLPKHRGAGRMLPFGKLPLASKEKSM